MNNYLTVKHTGDCENFNVYSTTGFNTSVSGAVIYTTGNGKKNYSLPASAGSGFLTSTAHGFTFPIDNPAGVTVTASLDAPSFVTNIDVKFTSSQDKAAFNALTTVMDKMSYLRGSLNPFLVSLSTVVTGGAASWIATGCSLTRYTGELTLQYYYATDNGVNLIDALVKLPTEYTGAITFAA